MTNATELERIILGGVMLKPERMDSLRPTIDGSDFAIEKHRRIWNVMCRLYDAGTPVDRVTVFTGLQEVGHAEACGGLAYLLDLDFGVPDFPSLDAYVEKVKRVATRRRIMAYGEKLISEAQDDSNEVADILSGMGTAALSLEQGSETTRGPVSTREMIATEGADGLLQRRERGALRFPWPRLDDAVGGLRPGQMAVLMAATSRGKTSMALQTALTAASQGFTPVIWTMEMSRRAMFQRMVSQLSGTYAAKRLMTSEERAGVQGAVVKLDEQAIYLDSDSRAVSSFVAGLRRVRSQTRLGLAVVDYLQLIRGGGAKTRAQEVSENSRALKLAAMDMEIPFLVLSQVDRASVKGDGKIGIHSAKESGDIENDSDLMLWIESGAEISRDEDTPVSLHVGKNREGPAGFSIPMVFRPQSQVFLEVSDEN